MQVHPYRLILPGSLDADAVGADSTGAPLFQGQLIMRSALLPLILLSPIVAAEPAVSIKKEKGSITFSLGDELITTYHVGESVAKPYLWPVNAPGNVTVTRGWPMVKGLPKETTDHVHQKSAWFCHGDVIPHGIELKTKSSDKRVHGVDFWSETPGHGKMVCVFVGEPQYTQGMAKISTKNEWRAADGTKIMDEDRTISVTNLGDARMIVFDIDLHASVCTIEFGDTKEGSFGVRVSDEIKVKGGNGSYVNAEGKKNEKEVWGRRSDWNDYVGTIGGKTAGIAIFDHPKNSPRSCWHSREYGLMSANPFGRDASFPDMKGNKETAKLEKGAHLKLRYGLLVHSGTTKDAKVAERFARFAESSR